MHKFLICLMVGVLAAAGALSGAAAQAADKEVVSIDPATAQWTGDLDGMIKRRMIRVLVVNSKTFYFVDKGTQRGTVYDFGRKFEEDLNAKLKTKHLRVNLVFIPVTRDRLLPALVEGLGDVAAANLTITQARGKLVDFTNPWIANVSELVVTGPASPAIARLEDLSGREVFVRRSSSYYESLTALNRRFKKEGRAPVDLREAPESLEDEDLLEMLNAGLVKLVVVDSHKAHFWQQVFPNITVHEDVALRTGGRIASAVRKHSPQLMAALNDFQAKHGKGTAFGNEIFRRYLKNTRYVKNATSREEMKKFQEVVALFRKYGDQYSMDWLLMAAQGYQESRLDQTVKSPVGAIGVMQVMPATGQELKVGDIRLLEPNIHAGVKYMRFMMDQYFKDEPMDDLDKTLFAFAAYNAGPGRVRQLRRAAQTRGLDPNVWFNNVELVAAEKIGRETVTYVSNIYKYYIAYKLVYQEQQERRKAKEELRNS